ncbi:hypothetical protein LXL04_022393 [Taraxacum kok-saghyz]
MPLLHLLLGSEKSFLLISPTRSDPFSVRISPTFPIHSSGLDLQGLINSLTNLLHAILSFTIFSPKSISLQNIK